MAKHVTQRSTVRLAGWIWLVIVALLLIAAAGGVVAFLLHRDRVRSVTSCTGSIELIIATDPSTRGRAEATVAAFNETHPAVKDTCIVPRVIDATTFQAATLLNSSADLIPAVWISTDPFALTALTGASGDANSAIEIGEESVGALAPATAAGAASTPVNDPASTVALPYDTSLSYLIAAERYLAAHPDAASDAAIVQMQSAMNAAMTATGTSAAQVPAATSVVTEAAGLVLPIGRETVAASSEPVIALKNTSIPGHDDLTFSEDTKHAKIPVVATMMSSSRAVGENQARAALEFERFIAQSTGNAAFYGDGTVGTSSASATTSTGGSSAAAASSTALPESTVSATPAQALARLLEFTDNKLPAVENVHQ